MPRLCDAMCTFNTNTYGTTVSCVQIANDFDNTYSGERALLKILRSPIGCQDHHVYS